MTGTDPNRREEEERTDADEKTDTDTETATGEQPTVLAVDDEERVVQAFDLWLDEYRVLTATSGSAALELMDGSVDVVLLDRHMPGLSGDEVLDQIRESEHDCRVAMVTAVDPDFDIVDMPFDRYVSKPLDGETLKAVVEDLLDLAAYDRRMAELYSVTQKRATLESEKPAEKLDESDAYADLLERERELRSALDELVESAAEDDVSSLLGTTRPSSSDR